MLSNNSELEVAPFHIGVAREPERHEVLEQLERIVSSSLFRNSRRYPSLLRHIVGEALANRGASLKERTLGIEVFGRDPDYDTNADPVVRISAGEIRKRIAQYYQMRSHSHELRIEIPLGSYQPRFYRSLEDQWNARLQVETNAPAQVETLPEQSDSIVAMPGTLLTTPAVIDILTSPQRSEPRQLRFPLLKSWHLASLYCLLLFTITSLIGAGWQRYRSTQLESGPEFFWGKLLHSPDPTLIVLGVHSFDAQGNDISYISHAVLPQTQQTLLSAMTRSDMIQLSDLASYAGLITLLTQRNHTFYTQGAADTTLEQLRRGPFLLVGGFNNLWTTTLTKQLRFRFVTQQNGQNVIQDSQHPEHIWTVDVQQKALSNTRDFGMVSAFLDQGTNQYVLLAGGIGKSGTEAAAEFLTNEKGLTAWLQSTKARSGDNVQVILSTDVIEGKPGPPQVVDSVRW